MRAWWVNPRYLCQQRLVGQHREIHMLLGAIAKNQMQHHPMTKHWVEGDLDLGWNRSVHYHDLIVNEMEVRGLMGHATPVEYRLTGSAIYSSIRYPIPKLTSEMVTQDIFDLLERWERYGQKGKPRVAIPDRAISVETIYQLDEAQKVNWEKCHS